MYIFIPCITTSDTKSTKHASRKPQEFYNTQLYILYIYTHAHTCYTYMSYVHINTTQSTKPHIQHATLTQSLQQRAYVVYMRRQTKPNAKPACLYICICTDKQLQTQNLQNPPVHLSRTINISVHIYIYIYTRVYTHTPVPFTQLTLPTILPCSDYLYAGAINKNQ